MKEKIISQSSHCMVVKSLIITAARPTTPPPTSSVMEMESGMTGAEELHLWERPSKRQHTSWTADSEGKRSQIFFIGHSHHKHGNIVKECWILIRLVNFICANIIKSHRPVHGQLGRWDHLRPTRFSVFLLSCHLHWWVSKPTPDGQSIGIQQAVCCTP